VSAAAEPLRIALPQGDPVSGLLDCPSHPQAAVVLAHGAGAGMQHMFMASLAQGLAARDVATLRFQFPFAEHGGKRPDPPAVAQAAVRSAVAHAAQRLPGVPLFAGGKSFGGRMSSQAQAEEPLPDVRGLVFVGFPLHPASKPGLVRAAHLQQVHLPMLFLQGTRDALADLALMRRMHGTLGNHATLHVVEGADHAFHVLARSGRTDGEVLQELLDTMAGWMRGVAGAPALGG